jgi:hypothetical protein
MKKEYYIQGDPARAEEIKAAFEKKGCTLYRLASKCDSDDLIYYSLNGIVRGIKKDNLYLFEAHPGYKELELSVKPNFKVGDWITDGTCKVKITDINNTNYWYSKNCIIGEIESIDKKYHLWTIQDAKDGDVLVCYSEAKGSPIEQAGIFKQYVGRHGGCSNTFLAHTGIDWDGNIIIDGYMGSTNILPATKEQRELLFAKMREAGYEWDYEKKELNKIQPHYDIANFYAGMPVLVRADNVCRWDYSVFSRITGNEDWQFAVCNGVSVAQCIPFEGNEKLLGTNDPCGEEFINW